jgi:hypothetical protein
MAWPMETGSLKPGGRSESDEETPKEKLVLEFESDFFNQDNPGLFITPTIVSCQIDSSEYVNYSYPYYAEFSIRAEGLENITSLSIGLNIQNHPNLLDTLLASLEVASEGSDEVLWSHQFEAGNELESRILLAMAPQSSGQAAPSLNGDMTLFTLRRECESGFYSSDFNVQIDFDKDFTLLVDADGNEIIPAASSGQIRNEGGAE